MIVSTLYILSKNVRKECEFYSTQVDLLSEVTCTNVYHYLFNTVQCI